MILNMSKTSRIEVIQYKNEYITQKISAKVILPDLLINEVYIDILCIVLNDKINSDREMCLYLENLYNSQITVSAKRLGYNYVLSIDLLFLNYEYIIEGKEFLKKIEDLWLMIISNIHQFINPIDIDFVKSIILDMYNQKISPENTYEFLDHYIRILWNGKDYSNTIQQIVNEISIEHVEKFCFMIINSAKWLFVLCVNEYSLNLDRWLRTLNNKNIVRRNDLKEIEKKDKIVFKNKENVNSFGMIYHLKGINSVYSNYIAWIISLILGGAPFSELKIKIREKMQFCYYLNVDYDFLTQCILMECDVTRDFAECVRIAAAKEISILKENLVQMDYLQRIKVYAINTINSFGDSVSDIERWYLSQIDYIEKKSIEEVKKIINDISVEDIFNLAQQIDYIATIY